MGPPLLTPRCRHSSCTVQSDDGSTKCIIIIGGLTNEEQNSKSTEILHIEDQKWVKGPNLPGGIRSSACVALPPTSDFACVLIGGRTEKYKYIGKNVFGLKKSLDEWTLLGQITNGRFSHIALPFL